MARPRQDLVAADPAAFDCVPRLLATEKYFEININEVLRSLASHGGKCEFEGTERAMIHGQERDVRIKFNLCAGGERPPEAWRVALKIHGTRVDGIDFEEFYSHACNENGELTGVESSGWHRHIWSPKVLSSKHQKLPLAWEMPRNAEQFITWACKLMNVSLDAEDVGRDSDLPFTA